MTRSTQPWPRTTPIERSQAVNLRKTDEFSSIPWLNQKLLQFELTPRLQNLLYQADLTWTTGRLLSICGVFFVAGVALIFWRFGSIPLALLVGLACSGAPFFLVIFKRRKRLDRFQEVLPEALDLMVNAMRAGHSLIAAMGSVARECADPVGCEFKTCFEEQNYGLELKTALDNMINRVPLQDLRIVATAIMIQKESGGNLAEVLDKTSHVIRERFPAQAASGDSHSSGAHDRLGAYPSPSGAGSRIICRQPHDDEHPLDDRNWRQIALGIWLHDCCWRFDHPQIVNVDV
jgi:tight adherence protein B